MRIIKKLFIALITLSLLVTLFIFPVKADSASVSVNTTANLGAQFTVKLNVSANGRMIINEGTLTFDSSKCQFVSVSGCESNVTGNTVIIYDENFKSTDTTASYTVTFKATAVGAATFNYSTECSYFTDTQHSPTLTGSATVNIVDPALTDANLSSLKLSKGSLSPRFAQGTTSYSATVDYATENITVTATANNASATVSGTGTKSLKVGNNTIAVTVTAQDGSTKKTYTINVKRLEEAQEQPPEEDESEGIPPTLPNPLEVTVNNIQYNIVTDISSLTPFAGFTATTVEYNGVEVPVHQNEDKVYTIYRLRNAEDNTEDYYVYDVLTDEFNLLQYMQKNDVTYIFAYLDENLRAPVGYTTFETNLGNSNVKVFASTDKKLSDFYYFYAFVNGKYQYYCYDSLEDTVQRAPTFSPTKGVTVSGVVNEPDKGSASSLLTKFNKLSSDAKLAIAMFALVAISIIGLAVFLVMNIINSRANKQNMAQSSQGGFEFVEEDTDAK